MGFHPMHKCAIAMEMLGRGSIANGMDDAYVMGESTILYCVKEFTSTIMDPYEGEYLQPPNATMVQHILAENEARGFPRMLESIDCMHWEWATCPIVYHGAYRGHGTTRVCGTGQAWHNYAKDLRILANHQGVHHCATVMFLTES
jgi:hypothetical protein